MSGRSPIGAVGGGSKVRFRLPFEIDGGPLAIGAAATVFLILLSTSLPAEVVRQWLGPLYSVQLTALVIPYGIATKWSGRAFFKPSMLSILYLGISNVLGAITYAAGTVLVRNTWYVYQSWSHIQEIFAIVTVSFLAIFAIACCRPRVPKNSVEISVNDRTISWVLYLFAVILATLPFIHPLLPPLRTVAACGILTLLFRSNHPSKWLWTIVLLATLSEVYAIDKRNAIFLLASVGLAAAVYGVGRANKTPSFRTVLLGVFGAGATFWLVIAMSIMRGYAGYQVNNIFTAILLVPEYLTHPRAVAMLASNFEVSTTFFHLHNAISISLQYPDIRLHGESFLKVLFLGIPEVTFGVKPTSIIESYTRFYDQDFRQAGGSYGVTLIGEAAWNFGAVGPVAVLFLYALLDYLFGWAARFTSKGVFAASLFLAYLQYTLLTARGGGLDMLLAYISLAAVYGLALLWPIDVLSRVGAMGRRRPGGPARTAGRRAYL